MENVVKQKPVLTDKQKRDKKDKILGILSAIGANLFLAFLAFLVLFPLLFMVFSSLRGWENYLSNVTMFIDGKFTFENYKLIANYVDLVKGYGNTMFIEICVIPCGTFFAAFAAFSFSKLRLRHKRFWLLFLLSGMMIPGAVLLMPRYVAYDILGWIGTPLPLIVPHLFIHVSMMFFFIQYMMGIPSELFEAAKIDGCSTFRMFLQIMLPLLLPAIAAQCIFWFMGIWNDFFGPSIYLSNENATLQVLMYKLNSQASGSGFYTVTFAGAVLSCLPMIAIYLVLQKFFIKSMSFGAVKG